jgi:hypothetical protein
MEILKLIRNKFRNRRNGPNVDSADQDNNKQSWKKAGLKIDQNDFLSEYLDGMGTATAKIRIDKHVNEKLIKKYGLKELKNRGRYYTAKIIDRNENLIGQVLVDKQNGLIRWLHR